MIFYGIYDISMVYMVFTVKFYGISNWDTNGILIGY